MHRLANNWIATYSLRIHPETRDVERTGNVQYTREAGVNHIEISAMELSRVDFVGGVLLN